MNGKILGDESVLRHMAEWDEDFDAEENSLIPSARKKILLVIRDGEVQQGNVEYLPVDHVVHRIAI